MAENKTSFSLIRQEADAVFAYKKIEQISTAVYMVANLMASHEPMRGELKSLAFSLLKTSASLARGESALGVFAELRADLALLSSYLDVSIRARIMSPMNHSILKSEIETLAIRIQESEKEYGSSTPFSSVFSAITTPELVDGRNMGTENVSVKNSADIQKDKPMSNIPSKTQIIASPSISNTPKIVTNSHVEVVRDAVRQNSDNTPFPVRSGIDLRKENRKNIILNAIQKKGVVTIRDVSSVVKDCSEKTIQRELSALVEMGALKREGERRWSTYSIAE